MRACNVSSACLLSVVLAGCSVGSKPFVYADGKEAFVTECSPGFGVTECYERAREACEGGNFAILDKGEWVGATSFPGGVGRRHWHGTIIVTPVREMIFRCLPDGGG